MRLIRDYLWQIKIMFSVNAFNQFKYGYNLTQDLLKILLDIAEHYSIVSKNG